jgi:membrane-associated phospholipid phosphatase
MGVLIESIVASLVRHALAGLSVYLVTHHLLTADQSDAFTKSLIEHLLMYAPAVVAIGWSVWQKYGSRVKFLTALELPPGSEAQVERAIARGLAASLKSTGGIVLLLLCLPSPARAQAIAIDKWTPALPTAGERRAADIASWGTVLTTLTLDGVQTWKASCEGPRDACFAALGKAGLRVGGTVLLSEVVKRVVHRARPCAPACGIDSPYSSTWSMHTALAFSALGGPRLSIALPLAIGTGGLRVLGDKHWLSDVLLGAGVGALTSRIR